MSTSDQRTQLAEAVDAATGELIDFVATPAMAAVLAEYHALSDPERRAFVLNVLLEPAALAERGVLVPRGVTIQRTAFMDERPTQFAMVKHLPPGLPWDKVTITFDNRSGPPAIRYGDMVRAHGRPTQAVAPGG